MNKTIKTLENKIINKSTNSNKILVTLVAVYIVILSNIYKKINISNYINRINLVYVFSSA